MTFLVDLQTAVMKINKVHR